MEEAQPDGSVVFRASWRSVNAWLAVLLVLFGLLSGWAVITSDKAPWALWAGVLLFGGGGLAMLWPLFGDRPVLQVGPAGVGGQFARGHTIAWHEIVDIEQQSVQGQELLSLRLREGAPSLAPTKPLIGRGLKRGLSLNALRKADRQRAAVALQDAFVRYAGVQAQRSGEALLAQWQAEGDFERHLIARTPSLWALYAVMALNVGVWLANLADGLSPLQPETADLFRWGASSASAVVRDGEWWRLGTATVLHGGLMHLALNMWALWVAGTQVIRWFGNGQFLLVYWGSALAGSALSLHFSAQQAVSVGASGAVFGVLGALIAGVFQHREKVPKAVVTQLLTSQGLFVFASLAQGFARPGIDNAAHIGGLLAGAAMAWLLVEVVDEQASAAQRRSRQWMAGGLAAAVVAALVWLAPPGLDHRALFAEQNALGAVLPAFEQAEAALQADARAQDEGRMSSQQLVEALEQRHIPAYRAVGDLLARVPSDRQDGRIQDLRELQAGVLELMTLEVASMRGTMDAAQLEARARLVREQLARVNQRIEGRPSP